MYQIIPATKEHALQLARTMRQVDKDEVWASSHKLPLEAINNSINMPGEAYTALYNDQVICMFGVCTSTLMSREGVPWLLGSDLIHEHAEFFLRESMEYVRQWKKKYTILLNFIDARNKQAIRWLVWLDFDVFPEEPFGPDDMPFRRFEMRS